ncbi:MAG TPA: rhomboid family intramembrane serine protease [Caulobacteraceae bacterium]
MAPAREAVARPAPAAKVALRDLPMKAAAAAEGEQQERAFGRIPWATFGIILLLALIFVLELNLTPANTASISPAVALRLGAVSRELVSQDGQAWRLLTAQWLHWNANHIVGNSLALILIGSLLEPIIGWRWLTAVYALGGVAGGAASITLNPQNVTSMGASGAIMAVMACAAAVSLHPAAVGRRNRIWRRCLLSGAPALLPSAHSHVDYSAHAGGALLGFAAGYLLLILWNGQRPRPPLQGAAMAAAALVGLAGLGALGAAAALPQAKAPTLRFTAGLIPPDQAPASEEDGMKRSGELLAAYPQDPRSHAIAAEWWDRNGQPSEAEQELQKALASPLLHAPEIESRFEQRARVMLLGEQLKQREFDAARADAAALCADLPSLDPRVGKALTQLEACEEPQ